LYRNNFFIKLKEGAEMFWLKIKSFFVDYDVALFFGIVTFGWVILYTFFILLSMLFFSVS